MERRVVITGVAAITPLGSSLQTTIDAMSSGGSAIGPATLFDASGFDCQNAAEVRDWDPRPSFRMPKAIKLTDRPARFAVAGARMAMDDARWLEAEESTEALGVAIGSSGSDLQARDIGRALSSDLAGDTPQNVSAFADRILGGLNPLWLLVSLPNMISAHVAIQMQARGPNTTIMSDWAAGAQAIGEASEWIRCGESDAVLAGGADSGVQPFAYTVYQKEGWLESVAGDGFVPGEGAAVFMLEERGAARARRRRIYAEIKSYAACAPVGDDREGTLLRSMAEALSMARWRCHDVTMCSVAAPPTRVFADSARNAIRRAEIDAPARGCFHPALGYPLAAAAPIDAAIAVRTAAPGARLLSSAVGSSGEAVTLALEVA